MGDRGVGLPSVLRKSVDTGPRARRRARQALQAIAGLGRHGTKGDGEPGWRTLTRGHQILPLISPKRGKGFRIARMPKQHSSSPVVTPDGRGRDAT